MKPERSAFPRWLKTALILTLLALLANSAAFCQITSGQVQEGQAVPALPTPTSNAALPSLTEEERAWLHEHPVIRVVQDSGWPPVEFADERGEPSGMSEDYLNLIEQRLGLKYERVKNLDWQEAYARLKRWEIDMTTSVAVTPERSDFWAFTKPYMKLPIVILTLADVTYIADMGELAGKKVAVVDGYAVNDWIPRDFPDIRLVRVKTAQEGIQLLQRDEVFAYVDNMLVIGYYLAKLKVTNVKIAGETPYVNAQSMAVRKDWAILAGILQKALDSISETERNDIYRKWLPIRYEHGFNYTLLWQALALCAVILVGLVVWNRRLSREIRFRKSLESALREKEERFRGVFEHASVGKSLTATDGALLKVNHAFASMLGHTIEEMERVNFADITHPDDIAEGRDCIRSLLAGEHTTYRMEKRYLHKNGHHLWADVSTTCHRDADGRPLHLITTIVDISDRKRAEKTLRESEEILRVTLSNIVDPLFITDNDGKFTFICPNVANILGYSMEAIQAMGNISKLVGDDLFSPEELEMKGEITNVESVIVDYFGRQHVFLTTVKQVSIAEGTRLYALHDITERKAAEAERERLLAAIEQAGEVIVITDPEGTIQYVNPAFETVTGYTRKEAVGQNPRILKSGLQDQAFYRELWETISGGRTWEGRIVNKRKNGTLYTEDATISPVRDAAGRIVNYVAVKRDISDHLRLAAEYQQSQKLESVGRLAGGVAHDFNNMLGVMSGHAEIAMMKCEPGDPIHYHLEEVIKAAQRSTDLVRQLLAFARKQVVNPTVISLNGAVPGMLKMLQRLIGEDIDLEWMPGYNLWPLKIDPSQVDQLLVNLAVNARDAISGVGVLTIATDNLMLDEASCSGHAEAVPGDYVLLTVSDSGCGMTTETLANIFEPFFTTKGVGEGTGLGLATVYGIVKQNEGFINVYSEPGQGTTFKIYLPRFAGESVESSRELAPEPLRGGTETVLVVEDESSILDLGRTILEQLGYTVMAVATSGEALRLATEHSGPIHLVITDVVMPQMNGRELTERLTAIRPGLKCLYMSGYTADVIAHRGMLDDGVNFIQKPFSMRNLAAKVREVLEESDE